MSWSPHPVGQSIGAWLVDADGVIVEANDTGAKTLGRTRQSVIGYRLLAPGEPERACAASESTAGSRPIDFRIRSKSTDQADVIIDARILPVDPGRWIVYGEDASARVKFDLDLRGPGAIREVLERPGSTCSTIDPSLSQLVRERTAALMASERQLQAILDGIPGLVATFDRELRVRYANRAYAEHFGYHPTGIKGVHLKDVVGEEHFANLAPNIEAVARGETLRYEREISAPAETDQPKLYLMQLIPDVVDGDVNGALAVAFEITELKRIQRAAEAANVAKRDFISSMSHEIRTPLNAILGFAELGVMECPADQPLLRDFFKRIQTAGDLLRGLLNDILDLAKIEAGQMKLERVAMVPADLLEQTRLLFQGMAESKGITLRTSVAAEAPRSCLGDPLRVRQVLSNLVSNAIKFTATGEVVLEWTRDQTDLIFRVTDTGIGMEATSLERLLEPFEQASVATSRRYGGTGLGLAITARLVQLMQGRLGIASEPGIGTRIEVRLPYVQER